MPIRKIIILFYHHAKLIRFSMFGNHPQYYEFVVETHPPTIINKLHKLEIYKGNERPPYSFEVTRYALVQR